jgi:phosphoribosylanthranilate isomerase
MTRVKICGITSAEDAAAAVLAGADALGFVFVPGTPRCLSAAAAAAIVATLPPFVAAVGVFMDQSATEVLEIAAAAGIQIVQLHGNEPAETGRRMPVPVIKALRVRDEASLAPIGAYPARAFLLDSFVEGQGGGTGQPFPWALAVGAALRAPIILAGGLTPETVGRAIATVRPYGVDVSSGVERAPGRKDPQKVKEFIRHVRQADRE